MKDFIVVKEGAEGIYEEKKSRFIAKVYKTDNESEAGSYIEEARKKYWDARHNCNKIFRGNFAWNGWTCKSIYRCFRSSA